MATIFWCLFCIVAWAAFLAVMVRFKDLENRVKRLEGSREPLRAETSG